MTPLEWLLVGVVSGLAYVVCGVWVALGELQRALERLEAEDARRRRAEAFRPTPLSRASLN